ncbi:MAG: hypothetical protein HYY17_15000 [Planctomycetes bacterium]|nr:hypothetical protein [Planctomycetota bacterium]
MKTAFLLATLILPAQDSDLERVRKKISEQVERSLDSLRSFSRDAQRWWKDAVDSILQKFGGKKKPYGDGG